MEVRIISLQPQGEHMVKSIFPQAEYFAAIDVRSKTHQSLLDENLITLNAFENLQNGRKYHHELGTTGAVGLVLSFLKILQANTGPVLICEDDCVPSPRLPSVIKEMLLQESTFDMVVFGPLMYHQPKRATPSAFENFEVLNQYYWGNHAVLFSSQGRKKMIEHLDKPIDVQLDALFSRLAMYAQIRILIQTSGEKLATQSHHPSTVQNTECILCDISPSEIPSIYKSELGLSLIVIFTLSVAYILIQKFRCDTKCRTPSLKKLTRKSKQK